MKTGIVYLLIAVLSIFAGSIVEAGSSLASSGDVDVLDTVVAIDNVCAWPNLTLLPDGTIAAVVFNQPSHGLMEGDVDCYASTDGGLTWEFRSTVAPHEPETVRMNHAAGCAPDGSLIVLCSGWAGPSFREYILPIMVCRSSDGGITWDRSGKVALPPDMPPLIPYGDVAAVHSQLLVVSAYDGMFAPNENRVYVLFSNDNGNTWRHPYLLGELGHGRQMVNTYLNFNETSILPLGRSRWLAAARRFVGDADIQLLVSNNGGSYWRVPSDFTTGGLTGEAEHPGHLLRLDDGRILLTYGIRHGDRGIGLRISGDEGRTWGPAQTVISYGGRDGGYPSSVQLEDGTIVTAFYSDRNLLHERYHMGVVRWRIPAE